MELAAAPRYIWKTERPVAAVPEVVDLKTVVSGDWMWSVPSGAVVPMPTKPPVSKTVESVSVPAPPVSAHLGSLPVVPVPAALVVGVSPALVIEVSEVAFNVPPASFADLSTVPSSKTMPPRARTVPATSSVASGRSVPMPTRPSGVMRTCSLSAPAMMSPVRKVSAPLVLVTCPSCPSWVATVMARSLPSVTTVSESKPSAASIFCDCREAASACVCAAVSSSRRTRFTAACPDCNESAPTLCESLP